MSGDSVRTGSMLLVRVSSDFVFSRLVFAMLFLVLGIAVCAAQIVPSGNDVHIAPKPKPAQPEASKPVAPKDADLNKLGDRPISVDVNLVLIPVTVTDPMNRLVTGLDKENFAVFEGSHQQPIKTFSSEDEPITVGVIFDMSGSMSNKLDKSKQAVIEFFKTANPDDEFFLIAFNDRPELVSDFTSSIEDIQGKLVYPVAHGRTALLDAIYFGMNKMRNAKYEKRALLIISDGGDNRSRYTDGEIKNMVKEADVMIYSIGLFDSSPATAEERSGPYLLSEISDATGGRLFRIDDVNELSDTAAKIGIELRNQYVIGYRPMNATRDGKWRKIKVKLSPPKGLPQLIVHAKTGYYAPTQ